MCWTPPASWTDKARSAILPISPCGSVHYPNISRAGPACGGIDSPVGIVTEPQWSRHTWASISNFMEGEWTEVSSPPHVKSHNAWLHEEMTWLPIGCPTTCLPLWAEEGEIIRELPKVGEVFHVPTNTGPGLGPKNIRSSTWGPYRE